MLISNCVIVVTSSLTLWGHQHKDYVVRMDTPECTVSGARRTLGRKTRDIIDLIQRAGYDPSPLEEGNVRTYCEDGDGLDDSFKIAVKRRTRRMDSYVTDQFKGKLFRPTSYYHRVTRGARLPFRQLPFVDREKIISQATERARKTLIRSLQRSAERRELTYTDIAISPKVHKCLDFWKSSGLSFTTVCNGLVMIQAIEVGHIGLTGERNCFAINEVAYLQLDAGKGIELEFNSKHTKFEDQQTMTTFVSLQGKILELRRSVRLGSYWYIVGQDKGVHPLSVEASTAIILEKMRGGMYRKATTARGSFIVVAGESHPAQADQYTRFINVIRSNTSKTNDHGWERVAMGLITAACAISSTFREKRTSIEPEEMIEFFRHAADVITDSCPFNISEPVRRNNICRTGVGQPDVKNDIDIGAKCNGYQSASREPVSTNANAHKEVESKGHSVIESARLKRTRRRAGLTHASGPQRTQEEKISDVAIYNSELTG